MTTEATPVLEFHGYQVRGSWDGEHLRAGGTNKASRIALAGRQHDAGDVVVHRSDLKAVVTKEPNLLRNGLVKVHTHSGRTFQLHYLKRQAEQFDALANALEANLAPTPPPQA